MNNKFGFILVRPQIGENIGACARAIKNFGFSKMHLVSPKQSWPNQKAKATSVGAYDVIKKAKIFQNTLDSISQFDIVFSLSARKRDINKKHISIKKFLKIISQKKNLKYGLMFGPEASGLSNVDISYSNYIIQIPTSKKFKSMNLSHSLTIVCYELFKLFNPAKFEKSKKSIRIASKKKINQLINHLKALLEEKNFFIPVTKYPSVFFKIIRMRFNNNFFIRIF